ncbi:MAG: PHP domain-containing protein [bacterium]
MNRKFFVDFHVHSSYSFDSLMSPRKILREAKKKGLQGIAITDHNTIEGALEAQQLNEDPELMVIIGAELKTEVGEIIGIFLKNRIFSKKIGEVVDEIHSQGGLVILSHPYKYKSAIFLDKFILEKIDLIESFNSRCTVNQNRKARLLAESLNKPEVGGSDAHFLPEIGNAKTEVTKDFLNRSITRRGIISVKGKRSPLYFQILSHLIKRTKRFYKILRPDY